MAGERPGTNKHEKAYQEEQLTNLRYACMSLMANDRRQANKQGRRQVKHEIICHAGKTTLKGKANLPRVTGDRLGKIKLVNVTSQ